jgi:acetolactate synthase small subunit
MPPNPVTPPPDHGFTISLVAADTPGVLARITALGARRGIAID